MESAASYICPTESVSDVSAKIIMGASAGFVLRYVGLFGIVGNCPRAALIAAFTLRADESMLRLRSNCITTFVEPVPLDDVISVTPAIRPNCRSKGVATAEAIVSGLAPGSPACTEIVGNSTSGKGDTGRKRKTNPPANKIATESSDVATGRRMNGADILISPD